MSQSEDNWPVWRRLIKDLEAAIIYSMVGITSAVGIFVWGTTKVGNRGGGLLREFKPIFGTEYGLIVAVIIFGVLVHNRRWKAVLVAAVCYGLFGLIELLPKTRVPATVDEFFALGGMFTSLVLALGTYYEWFDDEPPFDKEADE